MAGDIISGLDTKDLNEFKKDFIELIRANSGINKEYSSLGKDIDKYLAQFKQIVDLFNKKYKNLIVRLKQTPEELKLRFFIKDNSVKDVFTKVASRLDGLSSIGTNNFDAATIEQTDKFSKEIDKIKNKIFISYYGKEEGSNNLFLEYKNKMIELHYGDEIEDERSPNFKLCAYYAIKGGIKNINIQEKLSAMGFLERPFLDKFRKFFKKFDPRIEE